MENQRPAPPYPRRAADLRGQSHRQRIDFALLAARRASLPSPGRPTYERAGKLQNRPAPSERTVRPRFGHIVRPQGAEGRAREDDSQCEPQYWLALVPEVD